MTALRQLQLEDHVDMVVCGDDAGAMPKPHPHNALSICRTLDVDPQVCLSLTFSKNVLNFTLMKHPVCVLNGQKGIWCKIHLAELGTANRHFAHAVV